MVQSLGGFLLEYLGSSTWNRTPTWLISRLRMQPQTRTAPHGSAPYRCQVLSGPKTRAKNQTKPNQTHLLHCMST